MLRKFTPIYLAAVITSQLVTFIPCKSSVEDMERVSLFFVDRQMMRLIETEYYISSASPEKQAEMVIEQLLEGKDENETVRRMLPAESDAINVYVKGDIAYIDINEKYIDSYETGKNQEQLIIYQLVNSVASVDGISRIKFLFDGESKKDFLGEIDMREAFIPDYSV